ncbi:MAG: phosphotriesterase [Bacteroidota bacterium]
MKKNLLSVCSILLIILYSSCKQNGTSTFIIQHVSGTDTLQGEHTWLTHEHILVDFIGADSIDPNDWNVDTVLQVMLPYLQAVKARGVEYYVEITPQFLGRDVKLLEKVAQETGLKILTNTGLYGAVNNKYIPAYAYEKTAEELAQMWIAEYENGIEGTSIRPGLQKISVDNQNPLDEIDQKIVRAAALTHKATGLTIASHTGKAKALWPQLDILQEDGVAPEAFIWVHAQNESDTLEYLKAYETGCWISLDGIGWNWEAHLDKLLFAKRAGILDRIILSHDAGWYDPQKEEHSIQPYTNLFDFLYPALMENGFTAEEWDLLVKKNPVRAYGIRKRLAE